MSFDDFTKTLEFLTVIGEPRSVRIAEAWRAGGGGLGPVPAPVCASPYLYDQMRDAFNVARATAR